VDLPKLPVVSGKDLSKLLVGLGYEKVRQRGSHVRFMKATAIGSHNITIPMHAEISKGTLNDVLSSVSLWNGVPREKLLAMLRK